MPTAPLLASCVAALALAAILLAAGARLRRLGRVPLPSALAWPVELCLGAAVLATGVLLLGLVGALAKGALAALVVLLAAAGRWRHRPRFALAWAPALGGAIALPIAAAPPFFYDALVYHLGLPWQALLEGGLTPHPENVFAAFPPLAQCLYAPPLAAGLDRVPALLHWLSFVAAGCALVALARELGASRPLAALVAFCLPVLPSHVMVAGFPVAEGWMIAPVAAAYALLLRRRVAPSWPVLAGVLTGIACAARLQALPWAAGAVVLAVARSRGTVRAPGRGRAGALVAAGWAIGALPWWLKNLVLLGEPFAPLGWRREGMETLWRDGGSVLLTSTSAGTLLRHALEALAPVAPWLAALALAATLAVVQRRTGRHALALTATVAGTLAWCLVASLPRFLALPALLLLALAAAVRPGPPRWAAATAVLLVGAAGLVSAARLLALVAPWNGPPAAARGVRRAVVNDPAPAFAAAAVLPEDARVLFVGEARGFAFPRRFVAPSQHDVSPLRDLVEPLGAPEEIVRRLRELSFTHLLLARRELARLTPAYPVAPWRTEAGRAHFGGLLRTLGPPVVAVAGVEIYALDRAGAVVTAPAQRSAFP